MYFLLLFLSLNTLFASEITDPDHEHGSLTFNIKINNSRVVVAMKGAFYSLLGVDRSPISKDEKELYYNMLNFFGNLSSYLIFNKQAGCKEVSNWVENKGMPPTPNNEKHYNANAIFAFNCKNIEALKTMKFNVFKKFPHLKAVKVNVEKGMSIKTSYLIPEINSIEF
jgi:hypothetical protein